MKQGIPLGLATKINKINNHNRDLCMRGILPNQLRIILKEENPNTADIAFEDISKELFWHGYKIWLTRNRRIKDFWNKLHQIIGNIIGRK